MSKKRKQGGLYSNAAKPSAGDSTDICDALFHNNGGSLTSALFGEPTAHLSTNNDLFSSSNKYKTAVEERINDNANNTARRQESSLCNQTKATVSTTITKEDIIAQRRAQSESLFLKEITLQAPFPVNQQDDEQQDDNDIEIPADVRVDEISDTVRANGFAVVKNVVSKSLLDNLSSRASDIETKVCARLDEEGNISWKCSDEEPCSTFRFLEVASRCKGRMDVRYGTNQEPFTFAEIVNNQSLCPIINSLLGGSTVTVGNDDGSQHAPTLLYAGLIFSLAGSDDQPWHQDGMPLFPEMNDMMLPPYAINIFLPLTNDDASIEAGPTEFIRASHVMEEAAVLEKIDECNVNADGDRAAGSGDAHAHHANVVASEEDEDEEQEHPGILSPRLSQGDALLYDYRVCHRGTSNLTKKTRRILYLMYARPWFKEHLNFGSKRLFPDNESKS